MADLTKTKKFPNPHEGHRARLKETYLKTGVDGMHLHVVLELLLFFGIPYKDTNEIAHELINKFGSFAGVFEADLQELKSTKNMTWNAAILIRLVADISRLYYTDRLSKNKVFNTSKKIEKYLFQKYLGITEETVYLLLFDRQDRIINFTILSTGTRSTSEVSISKIVKLATRHNVSKIALAHNHPDNTGVSSDDMILHRRLAHHLKPIGVTLLDTYVITSTKVISVQQTTEAISINNKQTNK
ncbi:MAG: RadC family protein [Clostridia bacterium]|nr:RadC family protein [Clostridia bacterium]